jgi:hypothetical protein
MKLLTKAILKQLPPLYAQENEKDPMVYVKYFMQSFTWFMTEYDPIEKLFFGKVFSEMCPDGELGYTSLEELKSGKGQFGLGVERDLYFTPCPMSECSNPLK